MYRVRNHREQGQPHGRLRMPGRTYQAVESEIQVRDHVSEQYDAHVLPGIEDGVVAGAEEIEYRIQERQGDHREHYSYDQVQRKHVREHLLGRIIVLLAEKHGYQGHAAHAHERAHRGRQVHQREGHGKSAYCVRAHPGNMADIDAVDHIIQRSSGLGYDARDRIHLQEFSDFFRSELCRSGGIDIRHIITTY